MDFSALNPRSTTAISFAARNNDVETIKRLLNLGKNANCVDNRGWTALHEAAANDAFDAVNFLLEHPKTVILSETFEGQSALYLACRNKCSMKTIKLILKHAKYIVEYASNEMVSPLSVVSGFGRVEAVEALINAGSILDMQDFDGDSALHEAARGGHSQVVSILLHAGADPGLRNSYGLTPFLLACYKGSLKCVMELFPFVTNVNECANDGNTPLILATQKGALEVAKFLLANDANPDLLNSEGALPLYMALMHGHSRLFQLLLPVTSVDKINRNLMNFACKPLYFSMDIIITLLESDLGPEFFNKCDRFHVILENVFGFRPRYSINPPLCSILHVTEYINKYQEGLCGTLLQLLLTKGVAVNALYSEECPPLVYLHYCEHYASHPQVIDILVSHGCNVDYTTVPPGSSCSVPDALIASVTSGGQTLPILLTYSIKVDPDYMLEKLLEYNMVGQRISLDSIMKIIKLSILSTRTLENLHKQLAGYLHAEDRLGTCDVRSILVLRVPSLKQVCRKVIRKALRPNVISTQHFFNVLKSLPLPTVLKLYLRFS